jgi:hypothetical protein
MTFTAGRAGRAAAGIVAIFVVTGCGLTGCSSSSGGQSFNQTVKGEHGSESSVRFGKDARIPKNFPSGVPLPVAGRLNAVVAEANPPNASFTMTYGLAGRDGIQAGDVYRAKLQKAGFKIEHYSSIGGSDGGITQYDAVGKKWDVSVVSGKASPRDRATLSVQVHTHGQITSGIDHGRRRARARPRHRL